MSIELENKEYVSLLNALVDMQRSDLYKIRKQTLLNAEEAIVSLQDRLRAAEAKCQVTADKFNSAEIDIVSLKCLLDGEKDEKTGLFLDLKEVTAERDKLAGAIANAAQKAGIYNGEVDLTGPHLLMLLDDMAAELQKAREQEPLTNFQLHKIATDFIDTYEYRGEEGDYTPNENELVLLSDCIIGLIDEITDMGKKSFYAHPSMPQSAAPDATGRTPKDYAIEHGEYLAKSAEDLLSALNEKSDVEEGVIVPDDALTDKLMGIRSDIFEFRKRRDRAMLSAAPEAHHE